MKKRNDKSKGAGVGGSNFERTINERKGPKMTHKNQRFVYVLVIAIS